LEKITHVPQTNLHMSDPLSLYKCENSCVFAKTKQQLGITTARH